MSQKIIDSYKSLTKLAETNEGIIVSYSTGKDSMILMDLCAKLFRRVVALHMYFVADLDYIEGGLDYARARWGCEVLQMPHWSYVDSVRDNRYCNYKGADSLQEVKLLDIYKIAMQRTGIRLVATGAKKADGLWRRRWMKNIRKTANYDGIIFPLENWLKLDVVSYCKQHAIVLPELTTAMGGEATGIGVRNDTILWLYDRHPGDYEKMRKVFPHIGTVIARREFYGIGKTY
jgi:phosphoadenosine phosphosulfate reductase